MKSANKIKRTFISPLLWIYAMFVLIHIILVIGMESPIIYPDEAGYMGNARFLASGFGLPNIENMYYPGYSLFLVPVFWIFDNQLLAYRASLIVNSLLLSTLCIAIYFLTKELYPHAKESMRLLVTVTVGFYPPFLLYQHVAMSESAYIPIFAFSCLLCSYAFRSRYWLTLFLFGTVSGFLDVIHPKSLPVLLAVLIIFIKVLWPLHKNIVPLASIIFGVFSSIGLSFFLRKYIFYPSLVCSLEKISLQLRLQCFKSSYR